MSESLGEPASIEMVKARINMGVESMQTGEAQYDTLEAARADSHQEIVQLHMDLGRVIGGVGMMAYRIDSLRQIPQQAAATTNEAAQGIGASMNGSVRLQAQQFPGLAGLFGERAKATTEGFAPIKERLEFLQRSLLKDISELSEISKLYTEQENLIKRAKTRSKIMRVAARLFGGNL